MIATPMISNMEILAVCRSGARASAPSTAAARSACLYSSALGPRLQLLRWRIDEHAFA
jgi:hypothetical protein